MRLLALHQTSGGSRLALRLWVTRPVATYKKPMPTAAARPHFSLLETDRKLVRGWPIGPALLRALGDINKDVQAALAAERARLNDHGYPKDLPLPALWWVPAPGREAEAEEQLLAAIED